MPDATARVGSELAEDADDLAELGRLWLAAFADPPWCAEVEGMAGWLAGARSQLTTPGAAALLARDGGRVVGAAWGWPGDRSPDDELHTAVRSVVPRDLVAPMWSADTVVLAELMVSPHHQGRGLGGALLDGLVGTRGCWMLSHPVGAGLPLYRQRGWQEVASLDRAGVTLLVLWRGAPPVPVSPVPVGPP